MSAGLTSPGCPAQAVLPSGFYDCMLTRGHEGKHAFANEPNGNEQEPGAWHADWEAADRDGDGNLILRYLPSGGLYRVIPVED